MNTYSLFDDLKPHTPQIKPKSSSIAFYPLHKSNSIQSEAIGLAFCFEENKAFYLPFTDSRYPCLKDGFRYFSSILSDPKITKITFDSLSLLRLCKNHDIALKGTLHDLHIAYWLLDPNKTNLTLKTVSKDLLDIDLTDITYQSEKSPMGELLFTEPTTTGTKKAPEDYKIYCQYAEAIFLLKDKILPLLDETLTKIYHEVEIPLSFVLAEMHSTGIKLDTKVLLHISRELAKELNALQARIYSLAGQDFNINSPKQLSFILFEKLALKPTRKTKTGYSTDTDVLVQLSSYHELPKLVLNYRTLYKLKTTYADALPTYVNHHTGRLHTTFVQTSTATGRLSSIEPNLQNIPIRSQYGSQIRDAFVADKGSLLLSADYSQIELRILAHLSDDAVLKDAFAHGQDIHAKTAMSIFNVPLHEVTEQMRRVGKTINFGVIYGMSPFGLSESLSISQKDATAYIERFFELHKGVKKYVQDCILFAQTHGYVLTILGRKRPILELKSSNALQRQAGQRLAVNTPIQGSASDLIKLAMLKIHSQLQSSGLKAKLLLQIHDELLLEVAEDDIEPVKAIVTDCMQNALKLSVELKVDIAVADTWGKAH